MPEQLWFTALLNKAFGGLVTAFLNKLPQPFHPANSQAPITNPVAMELLVACILIAFFFLIRMRLTVERPGKIQHLAEMLDEFISNQSDEIIGHEGRKFTSFLSALFVFILVANLIGLIPTFESPTAELTVPLGLAVVAFIYYNFHGIRTQGPLKYIAHFLGPVWWLAWLLFPIEIISHLARMMSLTIRLYANIFAGDQVTMVFFTLIPIGVPVIFLLLHVAVSFLQAYIFTLLTTIYLQGAVAHEH